MRKNDLILKWFSYTKLGMVTQCCLSSCINNAKDQYLVNYSHKLNPKLGATMHNL